MGYHDYNNYNSSVLISHMWSCKIMVVMTDFFPKFPVGNGSIRWSGPYTIGRPWQAVVIRELCW